MVSHDYKCIFIHIPKCAGTSIEVALEHSDPSVPRGSQDHRAIREIKRKMSINGYFSRGGLEHSARRLKTRVKPLVGREANPRNSIFLADSTFDDYYKFTFVRNPWARAVSWYKNVMRDELHQKRLRVRGDMPFSQFLKQMGGRGALRPQTFWLRDFDGSLPFDYIGRFETLEEDWQAISSRLGVDANVLGHAIKGGGADDYRAHYDAESKDLVARIYKEEIELFGYAF